MSRLGYKVAIVTGAQGLAAEAAGALAQDGATLLIAAQNTGEGEATAAALRRKNLQAEYHHLAPADPLSWAALVDRIMRTHGHLDVLVNHAGAHISTTIEDATASQLRDILETDLIAPFLGIKAVIPAMRQSGGGSIINIAASPVAEVLPLYALYSTAKAGLVSLTKNTAMHCHQRGYDIRVNAVHPGTHETPTLTANAIRSTRARNLHELLTMLPARGDGPLHDFAGAITYLASDESSAITGTELFCTGPLAAFDPAIATAEDA
jgi:NAD(P)-dependent dehydrogenase (short-subunit alcohol dehydrogenase family)